MSNGITPATRIVAAANRLPCGLVVVGVRHCDSIMLAQAQAAGKTLHTREQGFIDNRGNYLSREEAHKMATTNGQVESWAGEPHHSRELFSEDLY